MPENTPDEYMLQAMQFYPDQWYERGRWPIPLLLAGLGGLVLANAQHYVGPHVNSLAEHLSGGIAVVGTRLGDRAATYKLATSINEAEKVNINTNYYEQSPLFGQIKDQHEFRAISNSPKVLAFEAMFIGFGFYDWRFAAPFVSMFGLAIVNNLRKDKRVEKATELKNNHHE